MKQSRYLLSYVLFFTALQVLTFVALYLVKQQDLHNLIAAHHLAGDGNPAALTDHNAFLVAIQWHYTVDYILITLFSLLLIVLHALHTSRLRNQLQMQDEINESHAALDQIFNTAADGMRLVAMDGEVKRANNTFAALVNMRMDHIIGRKCHDIFSGPNCHTHNCPLHLIGNGAQHIEYESEKIRPDGTTSTCLVVANPFYNLQGELTGIVEDFRDISERKQLERRLELLSTTDELTGLCNRRGFMTLARQQLHYTRRAGARAFLVYADLDNMKWINDTLGHDAGDSALITTAAILQKTVRDADIVGRMGGDEFAVLFASSSAGDSEVVLIARLEQELAAVNKDLPPERRITISFGASQATDATSLEELLAQADARMYEIKNRKKQHPSTHFP